MSIFAASSFKPRCSDCGASLDLAAVPADALIDALYRFRQLHQFCGYGIPFGPAYVPQPRPASG